MSVYEVTDKLCTSINSEKYDVIICNFANGDMVGHTGDLNAAKKNGGDLVGAERNLSMSKYYEDQTSISQEQRQQLYQLYIYAYLHQVFQYIYLLNDLI